MRSWLFVPGNVEKKIVKAISSAADVVIIDLEDSVPAAEKATARKLASDIVSALPDVHRKVYLRVNSEDEFIKKDLESAVTGNFDGVIVPKINNVSDVFSAETILKSVEDGSGKQLDFVPLIESAQGVLNIMDILTSSGRIRRVTFGVLDYLLDIGGKMCGDGYESAFAKSYIALACAAAGKEGPIDTVYPDYKNDEGFCNDAVHTRCLGYQGKLLIHPCQIESANRIYSPDEKDIDFADRAVSAFESAQEAGLAAVQVDGRMVDKPVYIQSLNTLKKAKEYGLR